MPSLPGFCGPTYVSESPNVDPEEAINIFCERSESSGAKVPISLLLAPGKRAGWELIEAGIYAIYPLNGRVFVAGHELWELFADGTQVSRGSLGALPTGPTQIISNENQLLISNNGICFYFTLATNVLLPVDMMQFNGPVSQIAFCDGYGVATLRDSHTFQTSNLEDFVTWSGLNISTVSYFSDNFTSMISDHREIWFYSGKKTIAYNNGGAGNFPPFIPIQGAFMEFGAFSGATFCTCQADNTIVWLDQDDRGALVARKAVGYGEQRISTTAVEYHWQQLLADNPTALDNLIAFTYQENGHTFWQIQFPDISWVYDFLSGYWHKRGLWDEGKGIYGPDRAQSHALAFGAHLVGDRQTGTVYRQSTAYLRDNDGTLRWERVSPIIQVDNKEIYYSAVQLDTQTGQIPEVSLYDGNGLPRPAQVVLQWSDDFGQTWSNQFTLSMGFPGQTKLRVRRVMLGRGRKRCFKWYGSDPIAWNIADCLVESTPDLEV